MKCKICGKNISAGFKVIIEPHEKVPEIKKTMYFCSTRCENKFIGSIKSQRVKEHKKMIRKKLENLEKEPTESEISDMFYTFTEKEKTQLIALGLGTLLADKTTCKELYSYLKLKLGK